MDGAGLDAIVITASGLRHDIKDYGFMFRNDPAYAEERGGHGDGQGQRANTSTTLELAEPVRETLSRSPITRHARCSTASRSGKTPESS